LFPSHGVFKKVITEFGHAFNTKVTVDCYRARAKHKTAKKHNHVDIFQLIAIIQFSAAGFIETHIASWVE